MIRQFGEAALLVELGGADAAQSLAASLRAEPIPGVDEVVPGLESLLVECDAHSLAPVQVALEGRIPRLPLEAPPGRPRRIPVVYGGAHGPDLADVARLCGLSEGDVVDRHAALELRVLFDGFAPGFAYLGELPAALRVPRLATPRTRTPAGSVGIAGTMSGIYPAELPGGWRVIGRTPITLFDVTREPPAYLMPGDRVRFDLIPAERWASHAGVPGDWT